MKVLVGDEAASLRKELEVLKLQVGGRFGAVSGRFWGRFGSERAP